MIRFFNNQTPDSIIDSATLTQEKVAKYVMENGIYNDTGENYFMCKMNWKHFLEMIRETMTEEEQWMDPNYMYIVNNEIYDITVFLLINNENKPITENSGLIYLVPIMMTTPDEDLIIIEFISFTNKTTNSGWIWIVVILVIILIMGMLIWMLM